MRPSERQRAVLQQLLSGTEIRYAQGILDSKDIYYYVSGGTKIPASIMKALRQRSLIHHGLPVRQGTSVPVGLTSTGRQVVEREQSAPAETESSQLCPDTGGESEGNSRAEEVRVDEHKSLRLVTFVESLHLDVCLTLIQERQETTQTGELGPTTRQVLGEFVPRSRAPELKAGGWAAALVEAVLFELLRRVEILPSSGRPSLLKQLAEVRALAQHVELAEGDARDLQEIGTLLELPAHEWATHQRTQQQEEQRAQQARQLLVAAVLALPALEPS